MNTNTLERAASLKKTAVCGLLAIVAFTSIGKLVAESSPAATPGARDTKAAASKANPLSPPAHGSIPVAFLISQGAVIIDFCGP